MLTGNIYIKHLDLNTYSVVYNDLDFILCSKKQLYEDFAEPLRLSECILVILDCAGHDDKILISSVWDNILAEGNRFKTYR